MIDRMRGAAIILLASAAVFGFGFGCGGEGDGSRGSSERPGTRPIVIAAAASTADVIQRILDASGDSIDTDRRIVIDAAATSTLARRLEAGAPIDVFVSADAAWMDHLAEGGFVAPDASRSVATNRIVLVRPRTEDAPAWLDELAFEAGSAAPSIGRLAVAEPGSVPAGRAAARALEALGWWTALESSLLTAADVRAALRLVERGEADAGIVYASDAQASDSVALVGSFPGRLGASTRVVVAATSDDPVARQIVEAIAGPEGRGLFREAGFGPRLSGPAMPAASAESESP